jgi:WD40 repeat protein
MHIQKLFTCTSSQLLKLFYHIPLANKKLVLPVIVGNRTKALIAGREDGKIFIWNNYEELNNHNFVMLDAHIFSVADVSYSHDQKYLFSCGKNDGMIISWRMRYYNE